MVLFDGAIQPRAAEAGSDAATTRRWMPTRAPPSVSELFTAEWKTDHKAM
jgi:hypothetical protein